jgi:excisionase family DNA binding protein
VKHSRTEALASTRTQPQAAAQGSLSSPGLIVPDLLLVLIEEVRGLRADLRSANVEPEPARPDDVLLSARDVASLLKVSDRELRRIRAGNDFPAPVMVGRRPRFRRAAVEAWMAGQTRT